MKATKPRSAKASICFTAKLVGQKNGAIVALPKTVSAKIASRGEAMIEGTVNGFPFREALKPDPKGIYGFKINKLAQGATGADAGEKVRVEILRVADELEIRTPVELSSALAAQLKARKLWEDITPIARRDWIFWICTAKLAETRLKRIDTACSKLTAGMRRVCCFPGVKWILKNGGKK